MSLAGEEYRSEGNIVKECWVVKSMGRKHPDVGDAHRNTDRQVTFNISVTNEVPET